MSAAPPVPRVACVMMQRDETDLLEPWLAYHAHLFGVANLYVFDNGSTDPAVLATLARYAEAGAHIDRTHSAPRDYESKHRLTIDCIRRVGALAQHDLFFPIDCDEFVALWGGPHGLTCDRTAILDYLSLFVGQSCALQHSAMLANMPGRLDRFYFEGGTKTFFAGSQVKHLEHGNHHGGVESGAIRKPQGITYLHLHNKPFRQLLQHAREKLKNRTDVTRLETLLGYRGHGDHLVRYFVLSERDYLRAYHARDSLAFPEFRDTLRALDAEAGIARLWADRPAVGPTGEEIDPAFDADAYLAANPDVRRAETPALLHYWRHGRRERRKLRPAPSHPAKQSA